uniref:Vegetative cell wall protein gp1 n=1 Tax=Nicotiana tabacum TaxID=4097 RepID=A0A1S3ZF71_TOBAC|nr:PREDICTED: vegetative cell wall protein gp1 [Nicotiana tabacum]
MVSGYASPSPSPSSSPPTPQSPLPVSVGPAHHPYYFSSSPSPSPPFSPHPSPHTDILYPISIAASPLPFSLDHQLQPHKLNSTCSCLLDLLKWFLQRCCTSFTTRKRCHWVIDFYDCRKTMATREKKQSQTELAGVSAQMAL